MNVHLLDASRAGSPPALEEKVRGAATGRPGWATLWPMAAPPETRYARQDGVHLAYQVLGEGPRDILLAAGGPPPIDLIWEDPGASRFLGRLSSFGRLVQFDARGWGASTRELASGAPTVELWADDLRLVLDALGMERVALVGTYTGAFVSMFFAAAHPERVSALVLIEGFARLVRAGDYPEGMPEEVFEAGIDRYIANYGTGANLDYLAPSAAADARMRRWWGRAERLAGDPELAGAYSRDLFPRDVRGVLPALRVPTLLLHRRHDPFIRVEHGRHLAAHIPGARLVELEGSDCLFFVGEGDRMADEIEEFLTGTRAGTDLDRMLATVVFTDIVASTERAAALGDRFWRDLLDRHDELARREVERFRGRVVKTTGDGLLAVFDGPARAIRSACSLRDAAAEIGLQLRTGIHTGEIEQRGSDVGGIAVHIAARVQALADPGQVLVSRTVGDLVAGSQIRLEDRDEHELKGVEGRWRLFAVAS